MTTAREMLDRAMSEAEFQAVVVELARLEGWLVYHTRDSRGSAVGFPDLVMVHPTASRVVFAELKSERGKLSMAQMQWMTALLRAGAESYIWRPGSWETVRSALAVGRGGGAMRRQQTTLLCECCGDSFPASQRLYGARLAIASVRRSQAYTRCPQCRMRCPQPNGRALRCERLSPGALCDDAGGSIRVAGGGPGGVK
ncbi:MAG: VRR-NUC domain-containing protein [SAR202 cluster bacterium]|nr:VRR-NUC domain-containing protein [SAR202 cluster bacterium]